MLLSECVPRWQASLRKALAQLTALQDTAKLTALQDVLAHPVAVAPQNEGEVVGHAQQLPKVDAALLGLHSQLMHQRHRPLNALLVVRGNHDLCPLVMAHLHHQVCTPARSVAHVWC